MGREQARRWLKEYARISTDSDASEVICLMMGARAAEQLGCSDERFKRQLQKVAGVFTAKDYFGFDPTTEPPPEDLPDTCDCGAENERGRRRCRQCKKRLTMMSRYAVWLDALIFGYAGERFGAQLGATFAEILKWLPTLRPYPTSGSHENNDFHWAIYAITHVVYTLNDYSCWRLSPRWLPLEYEFLKTNLKSSIVNEDPETLGEFLDTLKSFGLTNQHPLIRKGIDYLLATQNADGSWGPMDADDVYERYHPTWTAIDGLRDYAWRARRLSFPNVRALLQIPRN